MAIPPRQPIGDPVNGVLLRYATATLLAQSQLPNTEMVAEGAFVVRYGIRYLEKPSLSIVPGLLALDYGEMLTGDTMWDFIQTRSNLHPRADVVGFRNDGKDEMIVLKKLDLAQALDILVYPDDSASTPISRCDAIIGDLHPSEPARVAQLVPKYPNLEAWLNRE